MTRRSKFVSMDDVTLEYLERELTKLDHKCYTNTGNTLAEMLHNRGVENTRVLHELLHNC